MSDGIFQWWVAAGSQPETYSQCEDTRDAVIQVGKEEYGDIGFTIVEADKEVARPMDGDDLWERFLEINEELGGEDYFGGDNHPNKGSVCRIDNRIPWHLSSMDGPPQTQPSCVEFRHHAERGIFPADRT